MIRDPDQPDPRLIAELVARYEASATRLRDRVVNPPGTSGGAQEWNQARAAQILAQVDAEIARLKKQATEWTGSALSQSIARGVAVADQQARQAGVLPGAGANSPFRGSFAVVDRKAVEVLAKDTIGDLVKAADSMKSQARTVLRRMAATGVTNAQVNSILAGGVIEGKPRQAIRELREALKAVHGRKVTIQSKAGPMEFDVGYYAKMVAVTKTREATVMARHARLQERGIDLVTVIGRISTNFCTAYLDKVFSISGTHPKYPALTALPSGGPPFHPNCSKGTAPFIEDLADPEELEAGAPDPDTDKLLNVQDRSELQRRYQSLQMRQQVQQRAKTLRTDAGRKAVTSATDDPEYQSHLLREMGVKTVRLGGDAQIGAQLVRGLQQVVSAGGAVPKEIVISADLFDHPGVVAHYNYSSGRMAINPTWRGWRDGGKYIREQHEAGFISSADPLHVIYHEAAHAHAASVGADHHKATFTAAAERRVARSVSKRAAVDKDEFLAEVRAAKMAGGRFDLDVLSLYESLGGR